MGIEVERELQREEVYERIPWDTFERETTNKQWLAYAIAGAIVLGAFAYTFVQNRPVQPPGPASLEAAQTVVASDPEAAVAIPTSPTVAVTEAPLVTTEADLFAVDPVRLTGQAAALAEWFAVEYVSADGSPESAAALALLMPDGVPLPEAPEGVQVFVDWVGALDAVQNRDGSVDVTVLVRSLVNGEGGLFVRRSPLALIVPIGFGSDGLAHVVRPPTPTGLAPRQTSSPPLTPLADGAAVALPEGVETVLGGATSSKGEALAIVMRRFDDGVLRPVALPMSEPQSGNWP